MLKEDIEKVLEELIKFYWKFSKAEIMFLTSTELEKYKKENETHLSHALTRILELFDKCVPEELFVNEQNKSPSPDILNDCEVRREGWNNALAEIRRRMG